MSIAEPSPGNAPVEDGQAVELELAIDGMHCESCVALIEEVLLEQKGVRSASVDLASATAVVRFDPASVGTDALQSAITEVGYSATPTG
jgi:copper chaperone CopZ